MLRYKVYYSLAFVFISLLSSCMKDIKSRISSKNGTSWAIFYYEQENRFPDYFIIKSDGTWIPYVQQDNGNVVRWNNEYHEKVIEEWKQIGKSTVTFGTNLGSLDCSFYNDSIGVCYLNGNKYCKIVKIGDIEEYSKLYQEKYHTIIDSLITLRYKLIVSRCHKKKNDIVIEGCDILSGKTKNITFPDDLRKNITVNIGDTIHKDSDLLIKISNTEKRTYGLYYLKYNKIYLLNLGNRLHKYWEKEKYG